MKLQNFTIIFIIIILPIILLVSLYIATGLKTIRYQALYDTGLVTATQDAIQAFEINTVNNNYSSNAEVKRSIIKSSIKMFETTLCSTCNIPSYNTDEIEEYIPAMVFGMYDGFYMYAPSYNPETRKYEHSLKNYVYYSEELTGKESNDEGIVIIYYLDSYVHVSGYFNGIYQAKEGYLINTDETKFYLSGTEKNANQFYTADKQAREAGTKLNGEILYYGTKIDIADELAVNYFVDNYNFSDWFNKTVVENIDITKHSYLEVNSQNDPEDPESDFVKHKNSIIRKKIENVLNSTITAYSERTWGQNYKMPELSEKDWEKIYRDISLTTFFQGKIIGFTKYNGYCILNSNNHYELINPNLLYFSTDDDKTGDINTNNDYYHDIRCAKIPQTTGEHTTEIETGISTVRGWKIGRFQKKLIKEEKEETNEHYMYERAECACYECINGSVDTDISVYDYIEIAAESGSARTFVKESYWTSLARERAKLHYDKEIPSDIEIEKSVKGNYKSEDNKEYVINGGIAEYTIRIVNNAKKLELITIEDSVIGTDKIENMQISGYRIMNLDGTEISERDPQTFEFEKQIELEARKILEITYKGNVKDKDGNNEVENRVIVRNDNGFEKEDNAICYIINSNITVAKAINKTLIVENESVEYTITITNNANITDNICIKDIYYKDEIYVNNISTSIGDPDRSKDLEEAYKHLEIPIGNKTQEWDSVDIGPNETITIKIKAKLGKIGKQIVNTIIVKSNYTGDDAWSKAEVSCIREKSVKIAVNTVTTNKRIFMVLDDSNSMLVNTDYSEYVKSIRNFITNVENRKGTITGGVLFNNNAKRVSTGDLKTKDSIWVTGAGTNYIDALREAKDLVKKGDILVFFSDGAPTREYISGFIAGLIEVDYNQTNKNKQPWKDIIKYSKEIKDKGVTIYTVGYKDSGAAGLKVMASTEQKYFSINSINNLFDDVFKDIYKEEMNLPETYTSSSGKITLEYVDRIIDIKIDNVSLNNYKNYINGNELDLTNIPNFTGEEEITIIYQ